MSAPVWWFRTSKGDVRARALADEHYTRQTPGHPMWTRPGFNLVLLATFEGGRALWCWWRPKWESGVVGTERGDRLRALECTMFRRVGQTPLASELIVGAVEALASAEAIRDLRLHDAGSVPDGLITGIGSEATASRRGKRSRPGECFRRAGWEPFEHKAGRADVWLRCMEWPWLDGREAPDVRQQHTLEL